ncbi:MAG: hypothetical protein EXR76_05695 [Myxococcales bacterium]|nr:hypothetical protein [Myxococcales bacterium]
MGVLELAALVPYEPDVLKFIDEVVIQIAVAINNARALETIRNNQLSMQNKTAELEQLNAALEHANALKSEFLATVSHELRTPLNAIIGFSELAMETDQDLSEATRGSLEEVLRNGEALLALINDILDLSKIEAGKMDLLLEDLDPGAVVREAVQDFGPLAARRGLSLLCDVAEAPSHATLDRDKLSRIVSNLVSNALKFTEQGEVRVRAFSEHKRWRTEVCDTGVGIESENLPKTFEKFRQADGSITRRFGGTGLGLSITKELCHRMGGSVGVYSRPGRGSTFTVTLPLSASEAPRESSPPV